MSCADAGTKLVRRIEIFTGAGRRRLWSAEAKAAIVAESDAGVETVCAVARRHGLSYSQLFAWRRQMRRAVENKRELAPIAMFVPALIEASPSAAVSAIELEIDGVAVKIGSGADAGTIGAVIAALRMGR